MKEWISASGQTIRWYELVDSTNDVARQWANENGPHGAVVCADEQSAGRGRRGAVWVCPPQEGLAFSLLLHPTAPRIFWSRLALVTGLAVARCLDRYGLHAEVKWPNDVYVSGKKIGGILVEASGDHVIIGVGLNVNVAEFPDELVDSATSMKIESGVSHDRQVILEHVAFSLWQHADQMEHDFPAMLEALRQRCYLTGKRVSLITAGHVKEGMVRGINDQGEILLESEGDVQALFQADQIRVLPQR